MGRAISTHQWPSPFRLLPKLWLFLQCHKEPLNLEDVKKNQRPFGNHLVLPPVEMKLRTKMEGAMSVVEPGFP